MITGKKITRTGSGDPITGAGIPAGVTTTIGAIPIIGALLTTREVPTIMAGTIPGTTTIGDTAGMIPITIAIPIMVGAMDVRTTAMPIAEHTPAGQVPLLPAAITVQARRPTAVVPERPPRPLSAT